MKRKGSLRKLYDQQKGKCYLCGGQMTLELGRHNTAEIEHITPKFILKSRGIQKKEINPFNVAAAGKACNAYKGAKPLSKVANDLRAMQLCDGQLRLDLKNDAE